MTLVPFLDLAAAQRELADELGEASQRVLRSGWYVRGPELERFEADFASYCGAAGGVGVANGTEALLITLRAMGIGRGDEVLVSAHTSIATWLAITHAGARPVPIEPEPATMQIDPTRVEAAIGPRSAALIAVHLYGMPAAMEVLAAIASRHGLRLIEDGSQAHGARLNGRRVGSLADAAAFSLYPTK
ncbi:MAG: DegT/DnrJ/EryC1/StrS family aminotransferase, partial [Solirubrobacteraceae bacterium]